MKRWWVNTQLNGIRVLQKLTFTELVKDSLAFYWISRTNTLFETARHWPCTEPDESSPHKHLHFFRTDVSIFLHCVYVSLWSFHCSEMVPGPLPPASLHRASTAASCVSSPLRVASMPSRRCWVCCSTIEVAYFWRLSNFPSVSAWPHLSLTPTQLLVFRAPLWLLSRNCPSCLPWPAIVSWGQLLSCLCQILPPRMSTFSSVVMLLILLFSASCLVPGAHMSVFNSAVVALISLFSAIVLHLWNLFHFSAHFLLT